NFNHFPSTLVKNLLWYIKRNDTLDKFFCQVCLWRREYIIYRTFFYYLSILHNSYSITNFFQTFISWVMITMVMSSSLLIFLSNCKMDEVVVGSSAEVASS